MALATCVEVNDAPSTQADALRRLARAPAARETLAAVGDGPADDEAVSSLLSAPAGAHACSCQEYIATSRR